MAETLGVTQIGESQIKALIAGEFPRVTESVTASGDALVAGSVVMLNTDGTVSLISGTASGSPAVPASVKAYGVTAGDIPAGGAGVIWRTGEFVEERLTFGPDRGTQYNVVLPDTIFFQSARLAPNL